MGDGAWLPDGRLIYSDPCPGRVMRTDEPCNYWIMRIDVRSGAIVEKPRRLTNWVGVWMNQPSTTADGKRVAFLESSGRGVSYVADLEAGGTRLVNSRRFTMEEGGEDAIMGWTADSKSVIVVAARGDHYTLYRQSLDTDVKATITSAAGMLGYAEVSPDGKWVIMLVFPRPNFSTRQPLMRVPITGGSPELIFTVPLNSPFSCSSPPSNLCAIAEQSEDRKQMTITAFDPIKGRGLELARFDIDPDYDYTNENTLLWNISPDGAQIAAARGPEGPIQIRSFRGQPTQVIRTKGLKNMRELTWASDGKGLFVSQHITKGCEILHLDLQGNAKPLWKSSGDICFGVPSPDGRQMAMYEWKQNSNFWTMENF